MFGFPRFYQTHRCVVIILGIKNTYTVDYNGTLDGDNFELIICVGLLYDERKFSEVNRNIILISICLVKVLRKV